MSSSISSVGSNSAMMMQGTRMRRPDPTQMADNLFSKLDSSGQGYLTKADLQSAMDGVSSTGSSSSTSSTSSSTSTSSVDDLFSKLDTNGDGKVTKQEFSDTLKKVAEQLGSQAMQANGGMHGSGMGGGMNGMGGMPPPPPPQGGDGDGGSDGSGFTKDQLSSQLKEIGSSDSQRSSTISDVVNNFDKADTNSDGKVSFKEAMAYEQSSSSSASSSSSSASTSSSTSTGSTSSTSNNDLDTKILAQIMKLMQAYSTGNDQASSLMSTLSVTA